MKEKIKEIDKLFKKCRFYALINLPLITLQWIVVSFTANIITVSCALFVTYSGIKSLIKHYPHEKAHAAFMDDLPEEWKP